MPFCLKYFWQGGAKSCRKVKEKPSEEGLRKEGQEMFSRRRRRYP